MGYEITPGQDSGIHHPHSLMLTCVLSQALHLQRMLEELERWLEPMEAELIAPFRSQDLPRVGELLETHGELEAAVNRQARQARELQGQAQACFQEGHCLAKGVAERAQQLLQR